MGRKRSNRAYNYFDISDPEIAKCNICGKVLHTQHGSNLLQHLKIHGKYELVIQQNRAAKDAEADAETEHETEVQNPGTNRNEEGQRIKNEKYVEGSSYSSEAGSDFLFVADSDTSQPSNPDPSTRKRARQTDGSDKPAKRRLDDSISQRDERDPTELFVLSLLPHLASMCPRQLLVFQRRALELIEEIKYRQPAPSPSQ